VEELQANDALERLRVGQVEVPVVLRPGLVGAS